MRSVRISSTSRKPLVVIRPTLAPLCSRMALEATVVPWRISSMRQAATPVSAEQVGQALDDGARVVVDAGGDLLRVDGAVRSQQHDVGERAADVDADAVGGLAGHARLLRRALQELRVVPLHFGHLASSRGACAMSARRRSVAAASTVQVSVSMTTP